MEKCSKNISRQDLYKQVWEIPIIHLAKEYGLSNVGLAKICKKHNIPRPPRGYWAKKEAGQHPPKEALPNLPSVETIDNLSYQLTLGTSSKSLLQIECEQNFPPIVVAKSLRNPHPFVSQSAEILELCQPNDLGILEPMNNKCLNIRVSRKSLRRALRIMDALLKGLLERGFEVSQRDNLVEAQIHGECIEFGISEVIITNKTPPKDTMLEGYYQFGHSRFDYVRVPSGKLCLTIHDISYNTRKNWRDTKRQQLEDSLDDFVIGLVKRAAQKKEDRLKWEEEKRQRQEIERKREEMKRKIQQEEARITKLLTDAEYYHKSKQIRDFISAVKNERIKSNSVYVSNDDYEDWVKWAQDQADRLDPLTNSPTPILNQVTEEDIE